MSAYNPYLSLVYGKLSAFAGLENFWQSFEIIYGQNYDLVAAEALRSRWARGDFSDLPAIEVLSAQTLGSALGAYAQSTNKIYLSDQFVSTAPPEALMAVILEEIGHSIDALVNSQDSPGDEGEIFAALVNNVTLTPTALSVLQDQNDKKYTFIDNSLIEIEQSTPVNVEVTVPEILFLRTINSATVIEGEILSNVAVVWSNAPSGKVKILLESSDFTVNPNPIEFDPPGLVNGFFLSEIFSIDDDITQGQRDVTVTIRTYTDTIGIDSGPSSSFTVTILDDDIASLLNGPNGQSGAVGPTNDNDDFTNKSSNVPTNTSPGSQINPNAVGFTNTVKNTGNVTTNISLLPTAPANAALLPNGTVVTISYGSTAATYTYNGTNFLFTSGTGFVGGNPINASNPLRIDGVAVNGTVNYGVEIDLPAGTPLSTDPGVERGFSVPVIAFVDTNGNGLADDATKNNTINRVYTGFLQQVQQSRILQGIGPAVQGTDGTLSTDPKKPASGNIIEYVVQYKNISEVQPVNGNGNVILTAGNVVITEDGIINNWAIDNDSNGVIDTSQVFGSAQGTGTITYFSGNPANNLLGDEQSGTTAATDVTKYVNNPVGLVGPGVSGTFTFQRQVNQTFAGTSITNTATVTYEDPNNPNVPINTTSNTVNVTVAEIAGITVTFDDVVDQNGGVVAATDLLIFNFIVTNTGNDPTGFRLPNLASTTGPATVSGRLPDGGTPNNLQYSTNDGVTWQNISGAEVVAQNISVGGQVLVRVPVTVAPGAQEGDIITVRLGNTPADAQNVLRSPDGGDVYTVDNPDGSTPGEVASSPVNGVREASATGSVTITPVNDAPINTLPSTFSINEDTNLTLTGLSIADTDAGPENVTVTLSVNAGTLAATSGGSVTVDGSGTGSIVLTGTVANLNAFLAGGLAPVFAPSSNFNGDVTLTMVTNDGGNTGAGGAKSDTDTATITVNAVNDAPTAVNLQNTTISLPENTSTASRIKVADIAVTDDALGTETITLTGADASSFEVDGLTLFLKANTVLNFESKSSYAVTVNVDDTTVGNTPDATTNFNLVVTDVNEAPSITSGATGTVAENAPTTTVVYDANASDPDPTAPNNTLTFSLSGTDAGLFTIDSDDGELRLNSAANFEAKNSYSLNVVVTDGGTGNLTDTKAIIISVTDVNEAPTVALNNRLTFLEENTDTTNRLKVADISITDDALGSNSLGLSGADAALFEIIGTELFIKAGTNLDFETNPVLDVIVEVDDPTIGTTPDNGALFSLTLTNVSEIGGNDSGNFLFGTRQKDLMQGLGGNDILFGNGGNDTAYGGQGLDYLDGGIGDDILLGGEGNDTALGGSGNDVLMGGVGADQLSGGSGRDQFVYNALGEAGDFIYDFNPIQDRLVLTELFKSIGYTGRNPIADGLLRFTPVQFSPTQPGTLVQIDPNGLTDGLNYTTLTSLLGVFPTSFSLGTNVII